MTTEKVLYFLKRELETENDFISMARLSWLVECNERVLRKLIEEIRRNDLATGYVLISSDKGYCLSNNADEINAFLNRYLGMAFSQIKTAQHAKKFLSDQQNKEIQLQLNF